MARSALPFLVLALVGLEADIRADTFFETHLDASQVVFNPSSTTATGQATFVLNDEGTHLNYDIRFDGLDLEPIPANRTDPNDIVGMHIHFEVPDVTGPHILNIFGNPSEDDADLRVDYANESLTGIFDFSDASRDPVTGDLLPQFFPLTTKVISDWLDELENGELYLAVHTVEAGSTPPGVAIRGQIDPLPEPSGGGLDLVDDRWVDLWDEAYFGWDYPGATEGETNVRIPFATVPVVLILWLLLGAAPTQAQPTVDGQWSGVINWPIEAIHTTLLPTGKIMIWQTWTESVGLWDPQTQQFSQPALPEVNIFCAGHAWLGDGRLMVVGGHIANNVGEPVADIYDPFTNTWAGNVPDMNAGRWYPSATTLGNGDLLVMSGDMNFSGNLNRLPQVYEAATNSWRDLTGAQKSLPLYPRTFLAPDGRVVSAAGYNNATEMLDTTGTGQWSFVDTTLDSNLDDFGSAVMYEPGKVAFFGGGNDPTANVSLLDLNETNPSWSYAANAMAQPRRQNDATILADGTVLITGGSSVAGWNDPNGRIPVPEIWDPATEQITPGASASNVYRGYHSTSTLLPDGRVLITGGDHDSGGFTQNLNAEIYSPAYLFNGSRPTITSAPNSAELGETFFVETPDAASIAAVNMIVPGSTTHSQNWTQRINHLDFAPVTGGVEVTLPSNSHAAPPGYYMLFLLNDSGVPSIAEFIRAELATVGLPGDFNDDGIYDCTDVDALVVEIAAGTQAAAFDLDGDGNVDGNDLVWWLGRAGSVNLASGNPYLPGDANLDGVVDIPDFNVWNSHKFTSDPGWCQGDFNADGVVDISDFNVWNGNKFQSATTVVPEPPVSCMLLMLTASVAVRWHPPRTGRRKTRAGCGDTPQ